MSSTEIDASAGMKGLPAATAGAVELLASHSNAVATYFESIAARLPKAPPRLVEAINYSLLAGGKRLRPALVLECWRSCGGDASTHASALAAAGAMELIHTFSLVHDDLPAMDNDDLRRGRPTNHKVFGEAMAILAGDAMVTMAFRDASRRMPNDVVPALVYELAWASGPEGMIGGQVLDMDGENKSLSLPELQRLHADEDGRTARASCRLGWHRGPGGRSGACRPLPRLASILGLAFQIVDDLLDRTSTPEQMGKATGKDAGKGKNTYPSLLGIEASQQQAERELKLGLAAIAPLGSQGQALQTLARFVVERDR